MIQNDEIDILIVGGGLAGTSLAVELIERLHGMNLGRQPRIYVVEKSGEFGGGLAYHKDVASEFLLNDQLRITDCADFEQWLQETKSTWHTELKETGSQATQDWLEEHKEAIRRSDLGDLHIPRALFGDFMRLKVEQSRERAHRLGCHLEYRHDTVTGIARLRGGGFEIKLQHSGVVRAAITVLAVGAVPKRKGTEFGAGEGYFDGIYRCDLSDLTNRLESLLSSRPSNERRILIKGGNATAAEFIYFLSFTPSLASQISKLIVATPGGKLLPAAVGTEQEPYEPKHLQAISKMSGSLGFPVATIAFNINMLDRVVNFKLIRS